MRGEFADGQLHRGGCRSLRIAVAQTDGRRGDVVGNVARAARLASEASRRGAALIVFPEMYLTGYEVWPRLTALSLSARSAVLRRLRQTARRQRIALIFGYPERGHDGIYNAACVVGVDGTVRGTYRKIHLFGKERRYFRPGRHHLVVRLPGLTIGLLICYDLEFPESARVLALGGADLIVVTSANMAPFRTAQDVYVRSRAIENQVFVALANRVGVEGRTRFVGGSGVWNPFGQPIVMADAEPSLLVAPIDPRMLKGARRPFDYLADRRPESYAALLETRGRPLVGRQSSRRDATARRRLEESERLS